MSRAAPEERPALVAKLCKPKDEKRAGRKEKKAIVRAKAEKLETEASEPCEPAELPSAPSPELAPQPVKIDNQQLLEIAASRYHVKRRATGSDMLCEIEAAADNLKQRWEQAFQYYPDLLIDRGQSDRSRHDCPKPDKLLKRSGGTYPMRFYSYPIKKFPSTAPFLEIPAEYQRKLQMGKVKQMVAEFNGIIVNPPKVS